jgi:hypothetical protein
MSEAAAGELPSMFSHIWPPMAAQKMGLPSMEDSAGDPAARTDSVSIPILPAMGPIAAQAVVDFVANTAENGLLEGSQSVLLVVGTPGSQCTASLLRAAFRGSGSLRGLLRGRLRTTMSSTTRCTCRSPACPARTTARAGSASHQGLATMLAPTMTAR